MKNSSKPSLAIIGGSGLEELHGEARRIRVGTPYGLPSPVFFTEIDGKAVAFLVRHGLNHTIPPHRINYRANIFALHLLGVQRILSTAAVGGINTDLKPGDLVVPHDFVDFTKKRKGTFYDGSPVTHVDMSHPYCPEVRLALVEEARSLGEEVWNEAVLACTEGPRYETPAEVKMLRSLGCDVVGMTGVPEVVLSRELEMCYAPLCYVSNMAVGLQERQTASEMATIAKKRRLALERVLRGTITSLPETRACICGSALKDARL